MKCHILPSNFWFLNYEIAYKIIWYIRWQVNVPHQQWEYLLCFGFLKKGWGCSQSGLIGPNHLLFTSDPLLGCPPSCAELVNKSKATTHKKTCMISRNKWAKLLILTIQLSYYSSTTFLSLLTVSSKWERDRDLRLLHSV